MGISIVAFRDDSHLGELNFGREMILSTLPEASLNASWRLYPVTDPERLFLTRNPALYPKTDDFRFKCNYVHDFIFEQGTPTF